MSGGSADYNRYGAFSAVVFCGEGHMAPAEMVMDGVEAGSSGFIGFPWGLAPLCPSRSFHDG